MGAITTLSMPPQVVAPGDEAMCAVTVRNDGTVVDSFAVRALGRPAEWARVEPAEVALLPGEEAVVTVTFAPPRSWATPPGGHPFGLQVISREDPEGNVVEEGVLEVGLFTSAAAEIRPRSSSARGRRAGRHELALDNLGNVPVAVTLQPLDPDGTLLFDLPSSEVEVAEGCTSIVVLKVRGRKRFWRGTSRNHPFQVHVEPAGSAPITLDGQLVQERAVPAWVGKAVALALIVAALMLGLWLTVLKPTIEDSAQAAAADSAAEVRKEAAATAAKQQEQLDEVEEKAEAAAAAAVEPTPASSPTPSTSAGTGSGTGTHPLGEPVSVRVAATAEEQQPSLLLAEDSVVSVTDLLLQNPEGSSGSVTLRRGDATFYVARLENFRDLDLHLVAPMTFGPEDRLTLSVDCDTPGTTARACTPAVTVLGFAREAAQP